MKRFKFIILTLLLALNVSHAKAPSRKEVLETLEKRKSDYARYYKKQLDKLRVLISTLAFQSKIESDLLEIDAEYKAPLQKLSKTDLAILLKRRLESVRVRMLLIHGAFQNQDPKVHKNLAALKDRLSRSAGKWQELSLLVGIMESDPKPEGNQIPGRGAQAELKPLNRIDFEQQYRSLKSLAADAYSEKSFLVWLRIEDRFEQLITHNRNFELGADEMLKLRKEFRHYAVKPLDTRNRLINNFKIFDCPSAHQKYPQLEELSLALRSLLAKPQPSVSEIQMSEIFMRQLARACVEIRSARLSVEPSPEQESGFGLIYVKHQDPFVDPNSAPKQPSNGPTDGSDRGPHVWIEGNEAHFVEWSVGLEGTAVYKEIVVNLDHISPEQADRVRAKAFLNVKVQKVEGRQRETLAKAEIPADLAQLESFNQAMDSDSRRENLQKDLNKFSVNAKSIDQKIAKLSKELSNEMAAGEKNIVDLTANAFQAFSKTGPFNKITNVAIEEVSGNSSESQAGPFSEVAQEINDLNNISQQLRTVLSRGSLAPNDQSRANAMLGASNVLTGLAQSLLNDGMLSEAQQIMESAKTVIVNAGPFILRGGLSFVPIAGDVVDLTEALTGTDLLSGESISNTQRVFAMAAVIIGNRQAWSKASKYFDEARGEISLLVKEALKLSDEIKVIERYNPINPINSNGIMKLPESVVKSFRSSKFAKVVTTKTTKLYRVVNGDFDVTKAAESGGLLNLGSYWSRTPPLGPVQATLDAAIDQSFGNNALKVIEIEVPANFEFFEGIAGEINSLSLEATNAIGNLLGGGTQVYIPDFKVPSSWIKKVGEFK